MAVSVQWILWSVNWLKRLLNVSMYTHTKQPECVYNCEYRYAIPLNKDIILSIWYSIIPTLNNFEDLRYIKNVCHWEWTFCIYFTVSNWKLIATCVVCFDVYMVNYVFSYEIRYLDNYSKFMFSLLKPLYLLDKVKKHHLNSHHKPNLKTTSSPCVYIKTVVTSSTLRSLMHCQTK